MVGVARDAKYDDLSATPPVVFVPLAQQWMPKQTILVRAKSSPSALAPSLERVVGEIDPHAPRAAIVPMEAATSSALFPLGAIGLLLAAVGLYGTIAYSVGRRTREIGIRVAIGARAGTVLAMIVREGMVLAALGLAFGLGLAAAVTRFVSSYLIGIGALDALTFGSMAAVLAFVALAASYIPARRAASIDPVRALKTE